jgi:subfamily B ATP-binding cassette protein MsbA
MGYVRPHAARLAMGFAFGGVYAGTQACMVWVIKGGFKKVFDPSEAGVGAVVFVAALFPAVAVVRGVADYLSNYFIKWVGNRVVRDVRDDMFRHIHSLPVSYFSRRRAGELISRISNDPTLVERVVSTVIGDLAKEPLTMIAMLVWVFVVDARLAAISFILFPLCIVPVAAFGRKVRRYSRQAQAHIADVISILHETISGVKIVKAFRMEDYESRRFMDKTRDFFRRRMRVVQASSVVEPIIVVLAASGAALVLIYVRVVHMSIDDFIAFVTALFMAYEPVKKLSRVMMLVQQSNAAADRIFEVLDTQSTVTDRPGAARFSGSVDEIRFDNVSFEYEPGKPVVSNINLTVKAGERVAIVGSSGAGKTTFVNLVPRFYDVSGGAVLINGTDIRDFTIESLRGLCGLVSQETFLFNDTVANNIGYGTGNASREAIEQAARAAHAHEFVMNMQSGYDTVVGDRGVRMSGGQCQRIAIARAILRNPPILILDEATSSLDTESERMVQAALDELMRGRTVFAIAHRLSTITNCDRIIVLDRGAIAEHGSHRELLQIGGLYKRLYDMQFDLAVNSEKSL